MFMLRSPIGKVVQTVMILAALQIEPALLRAQTALRTDGLTQLYGPPYLLDFNFSLRDENNHAIVVDPAEIKMNCLEDNVSISPSETGFRLLSGVNKQLKGFLVLDYTLSMADRNANGDTNNKDSDALETREQTAKTPIGTIGSKTPDAEIGLFAFRREDAARLAELARSFEQIAHDLQEQYVLR